MIKSPFNFVPAEGPVFYPDSLGNLSVDVPFSNSLSGTLRLKITAESPVFVRNGHTKEDADNKTSEYNSFSNVAGRFFIPATTVKGCIRNVLSIMSQSEMQMDGRASYAFRKKLYNLLGNQSDIHCGWLCEREDGKRFIEDCGKPKRISLKSIDDWLGQNIMERHFSASAGFSLNKEYRDGKREYDPKSAEFKYYLLRGTGRRVEDLYDLTFSSLDDEEKKYKVDPSGALAGTLVLTGQPDKVQDWGRRNKGSKGKYYEFIFPNNNGIGLFPVEDEIFERYEFMYNDSPDWKFRVADIKKGGMPVFFRIRDGRILDFGLAYMYKIPYSRTPKEVEAQRWTDGKLDMAKLLFGYSDKDSGLKGRVRFSHFFSEDAVADVPYERVLGTPKASYYPIYIRQNQISNKDEYKTLNDGTLAGWKMYLRRRDLWGGPAEGINVNSTICPVKAGATFMGDVSFHNLRPEELGALVSAITFHGNSGFYHMIGQGKPYGFGRVRIEVLSPSVLTDIQGREVTFESAMSDYEMLMHDNGYSLFSNSVREMFAIACNIVDDSEKFHYMTMSTTGPNEFVDAKKAAATLALSSESADCHTVDAIISAAKVRIVERGRVYEEKRREEEEARKAAEREAERKQAADLLAMAQKKNEELQAQLNQRRDEMNKAPLAERIKNVTSLGNLAGTVRKWLETDGNSFGSAELEVLISKITEMGPKPKELQSKKKDFIKAIGEENTEIIISRLI